MASPFDTLKMKNLKLPEISNKHDNLNNNIRPIRPKSNDSNESGEEDNYIHSLKSSREALRE